MSFYAWTQDVPIDADAYAAITARMGDTPMPGLVVHLAMQRDDGSIHYLDVWESKELHDQAFGTVSIRPSTPCSPSAASGARGSRPAPRSRSWTSDSPTAPRGGRTPEGRGRRP